MIKTGQNVEQSDYVIVTTAGEALSVRDAVYISSSDGKAYKCDADDATKVRFAGFAQEAAALNAAVNVICYGPATGFSGLTIGARYFVSGTAGSITATAPAIVRVVGIAVSASVILIDRPRMRKNGVSNYSGTTAITCGFRPSVIRAWGFYNSTGTTGIDAASGGTWFEGAYAVALGYGIATADGQSTTFIANGDGTAAIASVTDTGFSIVVTGSAVRMAWEAEE